MPPLAKLANAVTNRIPKTSKKYLVLQPSPIEKRTSNNKEIRLKKKEDLNASEAIGEYTLGELV